MIIQIALNNDYVNGILIIWRKFYLKLFWTRKTAISSNQNGFWCKTNRVIWNFNIEQSVKQNRGIWALFHEEENY